MPSFLDGPLAAALYAGFKGKMRAATLRKTVIPTSGGLDGRGDPLTTTGVRYGCEGFTEDYSELYKTQAGIPATDLKVCIFAASLQAGIAPAKQDQVMITGPLPGGSNWYQIRDVRTDPATALWTCQAFLCPEPADP